MGFAVVYSCGRTHRSAEPGDFSFGRTHWPSSEQGPALVGLTFFVQGCCSSFHCRLIYRVRMAKLLMLFLLILPSFFGTLDTADAFSAVWHWFFGPPPTRPLRMVTVGPPSRGTSV